MLVLDILFHVLELVATFAVGAWTGSSHCRFAIAVETDEKRSDSWLDRLCCARSVPWRRGISGASALASPPSFESARSNESAKK